MSMKKRVKLVIELPLPMTDMKWIDEETQAFSSRESLSDEKKWSERGDHPLLNHVILKRLFGFVRRCDLKACRVVRRKWNIHTIPQMRATFEVLIRGSESSIIGNRRIDDFVKLFRKNELGIPFGKFNLGQFRTTNRVGQAFLQLCGGTATDIVLDGKELGEYAIEDVSEILRCSPNLKVFVFPSWVTTRSGNVVKLFPGVIPTFPNLKKIVFRIDCNDRLRFCPTYIQELICAAPNISDIVSDKIEVYDNEEDITISVVLNEIGKLGKLSLIQSVDLSSVGTEHYELLKRMGQNGLKLKRLSFEPLEVTNDELDRVQIKLATIFQDTLQHLKVEQFADNILMDYPKMSNMKSLWLRLFHNTDPKPVNLNEKFPHLETLCIGFESYLIKKEWNEFFSRFLPCPTLKTLSVDRGAMRIHTFSDIQRVFPNLIKLELEFKEDGEGIMVRIWTQMTQLESLTLRGVVLKAKDLYLDSLFTGIPTKTLDKINLAIKDLERMRVDERRKQIWKLRNDHCQPRFIGNLTKLKHMELNVTGVNKRKESLRSFASQRKTVRETYYRLGDLSAYLAFYSMNHLRHLDVSNCMFTKTCCEILTKETGLECLSVRIGKADTIL